MIKITDNTLAIIIDLAKHEFKGRPSFYGLSPAEIQAHCIASAIQRYVTSKGGNAGFDVVGWVQEDSTPVDEGGLDDMETVEEVV